MPEKVNIAANGALDFLQCLKDLLAAFNPKSDAVAFQNSYMKHVFKDFRDLDSTDLVRFFSPPNSRAREITDVLIRYATTKDPSNLNSVYRYFSDFGSLCSYCSSVKSYLEKNLLYSLHARNYQNADKFEELPASLPALEQHFNGKLPPRTNSAKNIERLNKYYSEGSIYFEWAVSVCPPNQRIRLNEEKKDHEYAGTTTLILITLLSLAPEKWRSSFAESLKKWVESTFFPPDDDALVTYIDFAIINAVAENALNGQLISEIRTSAIDSYDFSNALDLDLTEELSKTKDQTNPHKLDHHFTKSRRPLNEGDDIR